MRPTCAKSDRPLETRRARTRIGRAIPSLSVAALLLSGACGGEEKPFFPPTIVLQISLPESLAPSAVPCLDLVLRAPVGTPPSTAIGFGGNPLFLRVETVDLDGDTRDETLIRFKKGSTPFLSGRSSIVITPGEAAGTDPTATFTVSATARAADGAVALDDLCLGGTVVAMGKAEADQGGRPIQFPSKGSTLVDLPLSMVP